MISFHFDDFDLRSYEFKKKKNYQISFRVLSTRKN